MEETSPDKSDKFILIGINDAENVAEVLKNKTAKKIIELLGNTKEASEKDIADKLGIPINTVEYNLKKLINAGFIKKSKNFFWSIKGKKIEVYKLANQHIIISPEKKPSLSYLKTILPIFIVAALLVIFAGYFMFFGRGGGEKSLDTREVELKQFNSLEEIQEFLKKTVDSRSKYGDVLTMESAPVTGANQKSTDSAESGSGDYSTTNVQVEGVDEADIVKTDGKYIYSVTGNKLVIVEAYPAEQMKVISEINFSDSQISEIYINKNKLIIFGNNYYASDASSSVKCSGSRCGSYYNSQSIVYIYDITNKANPVLKDKIGSEGDYVDSRMIGNYVYVIHNKYIDQNIVLPVYSVNGVEKSTLISDVYYPPYPDTNYVFNIIMAIDLENGEINNKVYLTGGTYNIYVSQKNIYLTNEKYFNYYDYYDEMVGEVFIPLVNEETAEKIKKVLERDEANWEKQNNIQKIIKDYSNSLGGLKGDFDGALMAAIEKYNEDLLKKQHKTIVYKIGLDKLDIEYKSTGEVPGSVLNQFSMDEYKGNLRVATTTGEIWSGNSLNHLYILDKDLKIIGKIEDLAKGEKIYSARFIGERAYIVTFKKVDPLFVIDVSDPKNPVVLGYLKIPGYSDYLHPYDSNHVIGIGKETAEASEDEKGSRDLDFAWYQGVKISLFDVSNVEAPVEKHKIVIGDRGTNSPALYEHKAFLFNREKALLVLPIELYEINKSKYSGKISSDTYGEFVWQGAYVFEFNLNRINLKGRITHDNETQDYSNIDYYWGNWKTAIKRSLYISNVLYTVSDYKIKANKLADLNEINETIIGTNDEPVYYVGIE